MDKQISPQKKKLQELNIVANPASTRIKTYFSALAKGAISGQLIPNSVRKVLSQYPTEDYLVHLQLFLHIEIDEVIQLRENTELEPLAPTNYCGYPPQLYVDLIFELKLHSEFIQMLAATKGMSFSKDLLSLALRRAKPELERGFLEYSIVYKYLILLGQLSRGHSENNGEPFYVESFVQLIGCLFQKTHYTCTSTIEPQKVHILLKLAGVVCMIEEDYTGDTEIAELNKEWNIDPISFGSLKTKQLFQTVLDRPEEGSLPISLGVLEIVETIFKVEDVCSKFQPISHPASVLENLGVCAYVAGELLERNAKNIKDDCRSALLSVMAHFSAYKPKLSWNDWKDMATSYSFEEFCQLLTLHGNRKRYQDGWFRAFCEYPEDFVSETGLRIAEELIAPNATVDIAVEFVQKVLLLHGSVDSNSEDIRMPELKKIVLSLLENENVKKHRDEFIQKIFDSGVHSHFAQEKFMKDLNSISTKIGAIEVETDPKCIAFYVDLLYNLCFQNGVETVKVILQTSIRSQYFRALHMIKIYLNLPYTPPPSTNESPVNTPTVIEEVLQRILTSVHELDPMCDYIAKGLPLVISEGFIRFEQVMKAIQVATDQAIVKEQFEKMAKLVSIYEQLVIYSLTKDEDVSADFQQFIGALLLFTYVKLQTGKIGPFMLARESCLKILGMIQEKNMPNVKSHLEEDPSQENFKKYTLIQLGLVYSRSGSERKRRIEDFLSNPQNCWKGTTSKSDLYGKLVLSLLNWVTNSCVSEWPHLVNFLMNVILRRPEYKNVSIYELVSDGLLASRKEWECPTIYYLKFYAFVLTTLQNLKSENFHEKVEEHKLVYRTIVTLTLRSFEARPTKPSPGRLQNISQIFQQALMVTLDFTEWIVMNCDDYEKNLKDDALYLLSLIEGNIRGHTSYVLPIYQSIIARLNLGKKNLAETSEAPKKKLVTGPELSAPVLMSDKIFNQYMELSAAEEIMTNALDKDKCEEREVRDLYPFKNRRPPVKRAGFKFH